MTWAFIPATHGIWLHHVPLNAQIYIRPVWGSCPGKLWKFR